mmetsp:Transcript_17898/g.25239  ORF Transcript_17898/g.25239 Transcript_17898/m.25239 type:complete len:1117 (+) Transcript_17898:610-3960(+)
MSDPASRRRERMRIVKDRMADMGYDHIPENEEAAVDVTNHSGPGKPSPFSTVDDGHFSLFKKTADFRGSTVGGGFRGGLTWDFCVDTPPGHGPKLDLVTALRTEEESDQDTSDSMDSEADHDVDKRHQFETEGHNKIFSRGFHDNLPIEISNYNVIKEYEDEREEEQQTIDKEDISKDSLSDGRGSNLVTEESYSRTLAGIDFLKDDPKTMTRVRRIGLYLAKWSFYNPAVFKEQMEKQKTKLFKDKSKPISKKTFDESARSQASFKRQSCTNSIVMQDKPSLEKAWAYFEHVTLPRYHYEEKKDKNVRKSVYKRFINKWKKGNKQFQMAEPGENQIPTRLYSWFWTPLKQMGDFGLGVGLYFSTLRALTVITIIAGIINIPNALYFAGQDYSDGQEGVHPFQKGSAICTRTEWVPCEDCTIDKFAGHRIATLVNDTSLTYALRNDCEGTTMLQGFINFSSLMFVVVGIYIMNHYQKLMAIKFDEDEQTAQDYSIVVENPPPDATDPEEWRTFFRECFEGARLTCCTVALDNDILVQCLVNRRVCFHRLQMMLDPGSPLDAKSLERYAKTANNKRGMFMRFFAIFSPGIPELVHRINRLTFKIQRLAQFVDPYRVTRVFLTFETEEDQRRVLSALSVGSYQASSNTKRGVPPSRGVPKDHLFRGIYVLEVNEPDEPSTIRWADLNARAWQRRKVVFLTTLATFCTIVLGAFVVNFINSIGQSFTAIAISAGNLIFPIFAKFLTTLESHPDAGSVQTSLYCKIALFRWVNTAIVITIITPFTSTLEADTGVIPSIFKIFVADIVMTNCIQIADPIGHLQKHIVAPWAKTQDAMNLAMSGTDYELAERYTNMTKLLFLAFWFNALYPGAFFICGLGFIFIFIADRFSLTRSWARTPKLGTSIADASPDDDEFLDNSSEDNLAEMENVTLKTHSGQVEIVPISLGNTYKYCQQEMFRNPGNRFPAIPSSQPDGANWMTEDQEFITKVFGWTSVAVLGYIFLKFVWLLLLKIKSIFASDYEARGDVQGINYSDIEAVSAYIPQVNTRVFAYPLIATDTKSFDPELFDWADADRSHDYYDLTLDAEEILQNIHVTATNMFSKVAHWDPDEQFSHADTISDM